MRFYPVNLNISRKLCIVVGGGKVAERKVKNILFCGGKVKIISPRLSPELAKAAKAKKIAHAKSEYRIEALKGAYLVFAATYNRKVNSKIARDAAKSGILVNVCDSARKSTFILPAILKKKGVTVAVSTDGLSPRKAVKIRDKLKGML